jgi:hypothetical protein
MLHWFAEGIPPEIGGLPTWALNGLSIASLVSLIIISLFTSRLWTKRQVDEMVKQHEREVKDLKDRYELHINRTVELLEKRADDARTRENEWRDVALRWQSVAEMLAQGLEPLQDQGETMLRLLQAWQSEARRAIGQ